MWSVDTHTHTTIKALVVLLCFPRVISRAPGLKLVVETLISSLRPIGNIVLICCAFFIIFGILGVQVRLSATFLVSAHSESPFSRQEIIPPMAKLFRISFFLLALRQPSAPQRSYPGLQGNPK